MNLIEICSLCALDKFIMNNPSATVKLAMEKAGEPIHLTFSKGISQQK
jgi:hypothetical protein